MGILEGDSSNVIKLVEDTYDKLSQKIRLQNSNIPEGIKVNIKARCSPGGTYEGKPYTVYN